ncbi:MAG: family 16 glycoside hydrolase [Pseudonocardiaceae bacterium]
MTFRVVGIAVTLLGCQPAGSALHAGAGNDELLQPWAEGSVHGPWHAVYTGYGSIGVRHDTIVLSPAPARQPDETHAALVAGTEVRSQTEFVVRLRTVRQLRQPLPNPWEVGWVLWGYRDPVHFYYVVLKPNGWEVGKADPAYPGQQRCITTGTTPYPIGQWIEVRVQYHGANTTVWVNGAPLTTIVDTERPYTDGAVGLYTEDAAVQFIPVRLGAPG